MQLGKLYYMVWITHQEEEELWMQLEEYLLAFTTQPLLEFSILFIYWQVSFFLFGKNKKTFG